MPQGWCSPFAANVWPLWVDNTTGSYTNLTTATYTNSASANASAIWLAWVNGTSITTGTLTNSTVTNVVWCNWIGNLIPEPFPEVDAVAAATRDRERREALRRDEERREIERAERVEAAARARALLEGALDPDQLREFAAHRRFRVLSADGERVYEVRCDGSRHGNVRRVGPEGQTLARYCAAPAAEMPDDDAFLAQKLWLEADEEGFRAVANVS